MAAATRAHETPGIKITVSTPGPILYNYGISVGKFVEPHVGHPVVDKFVEENRNTNLGFIQYDVMPDPGTPRAIVRFQPYIWMKDPKPLQRNNLATLMEHLILLELSTHIPTSTTMIHNTQDPGRLNQLEKTGRGKPGMTLAEEIAAISSYLQRKGLEKHLLVKHL